MTRLHTSTARGITQSFISLIRLEKRFRIFKKNCNLLQVSLIHGTKFYNFHHSHNTKFTKNYKSLPTTKNKFFEKFYKFLTRTPKNVHAGIVTGVQVPPPPVKRQAFLLLLSPPPSPLHATSMRFILPTILLTHHLTPISRPFRSTHPLLPVPNASVANPKMAPTRKSFENNWPDVCLLCLIASMFRSNYYQCVCLFMQNFCLGVLTFVPRFFQLSCWKILSYSQFK